MGSKILRSLRTCRHAEAKEDCSLSLSLDPDHIEAYYTRAKARTKLGELEDAKLGKKPIQG